MHFQLKIVWGAKEDPCNVISHMRIISQLLSLISVYSAISVLNYCCRYSYKLYVSNLSALYFTIQLLIGACLLYSLFFTALWGIWGRYLVGVVALKPHKHVEKNPYILWNLLSTRLRLTCCTQWCWCWWLKGNHFCNRIMMVCETKRGGKNPEWLALSLTFN